MRSSKKESRTKIPSKFVEPPENMKEKKRAKAPEQPTPPIQEEPEPVSNILQGDDILALAIKKEDLKKLAELIHIPPSLMTLISAKEEPQQKDPKEEKRHPWVPPPQQNFLKNWQRHITLRKKQQEALSEHLKKPVSELLMHSGDTYRQIQEERELIDRILPTQHDGKSYKDTSVFWSPLEYLGDEMTGLVITKTKTQHGFVEPIARIRKPRSIRVETGLPAQKDAWYRYTWDRSLFLIYRRKELQSILAELDFSQQDIDGLEVVGRGQPFSSVTVEDRTVFERLLESPPEDKVRLDLLDNCPDSVSMPVLGPSLLFCGKPACWIRGSNPQDKRQIGIGVRLTFETLEGEKTSSELTVVNNGTVAIWYDWRRLPQLDSFQHLKRDRMQQFYFNNREGVILPGETKNFTFFFKSSSAGIFRECWEFKTHPTLLGGALLQVNLHAVSLAQDIFKDERKLLESKLATHDAVSIAKDVLQELLRGILTPERMPSPVDAYLTEEELFCHRNPHLYYQHRVVQNLHQLWNQCRILSAKSEEARPGEEEHLSPRVPVTPSAHLEKASSNVDNMTNFRNPVREPQLSRHENEAQGNFQDYSTFQKTRVGTKISQRKSIMEEILVEIPEVDSTRSPCELPGVPLTEWNLCLKEFRKAVMKLPEDHQKEDALISLNKAALELCQEQKPLQSNLLHQLCLQLWRDVIDSLVNHSLWLRVLLGLPEKETIYLDVPEEQDRKSPPITEVKTTAGKIGKETEGRKGAIQEKKQLGIRDKEDKKGARMAGKEDRINSKKQKAKDDKKILKSSSRDRLSSDDPAPDSTVPSHEPIDPLVKEKYMRRMHTEVFELLNVLVTDLMILADELSPIKNVEESLHLCS
ncbi:MYCBP-associated protein isoform X3 [Marmota marmota marmota]|uniref:MYCBP-associated protein isoform X3 n=1 Tax=Marmota marmota marmota TaxID=9994 RepID=UPI002092406F|nr:MYCBP-associated protein isoform X3 [Marmota marmota marmota]